MLTSSDGPAFWLPRIAISNGPSRVSASIATSFLFSARFSFFHNRCAASWAANRLLHLFFFFGLCKLAATATTTWTRTWTPVAALRMPIICLFLVGFYFGGKAGVEIVKYIQ